MKKPPLSAADEARYWRVMTPECKYDSLRYTIAQAVQSHFDRLRHLGQSQHDVCPLEVDYINAQIQALEKIGLDLKLGDVDRVNAWLSPLHKANCL